MLEQWFLDLDGVRSGPYQTSEVLSLVAEGEVLPHHLISTELKSENWMSILEWRMSQNKMTPVTPSENFKVSDSEKIETEVPPTAKEVVFEIKDRDQIPAFENQVSTEGSGISPETEKVTFSPIIAKESGSKHDPMAEMFDILQNTKQKREQKTQQAQQLAQQQAQTTVDPVSATTGPYSVNGSNQSSKRGMIGTVIAAILVTIVGFALGQYFQKQANQEPASSAAVPASTNPSEASLDASASGPKTTEIVDQSNEKITIRSKVPSSELNKVEHNAPPQPPAPPVTSHHGNQQDHPDLQEIKDLKKELMELKALKEEIRNTPEPMDLPDTRDQRDQELGIAPGASGMPGTVGGSIPSEGQLDPNTPENGAPNKSDQEIQY